MNEVREWLERVKQALYVEGFRDTFLQVWKEGQVFGLVKKIDDIWEMHVRGFEDGHLEAEIEVSRDYLEHLNDKYRRPAINRLSKILDRHNIPYNVVGNPEVMSELEPPRTLTPWKPIVVSLLTIASIVFLACRGSKRYN